MATEFENLRRIQNLEASLQALTNKVAEMSAAMTKLQAMVNSLVSTVNGMTKP